jgi:pimeloyl-ACP methyl ester carboxylesterase
MQRFFERGFRDTRVLLVINAAVLSVLLSSGGCVHASGPRLPPGRLQEDLVFARYSPLSRAAEIARRTLTPLTFLYGQQGLSTHQVAFREQSIDLSHEKFNVYIPAGEPPTEGYGLLVFVAPWPDPTRPNHWRPPLDRHHLIFVAATNSGDEVSFLDRRLPLALLGYENVRALYPIDPKRVFVYGLSGGSRVAEVAALAYPDVFRGALLNAGSDPIGGEEGIYLPPADLFHKFQETRLVYITGVHDELNLHADRVSRDSMLEWCVFDLSLKEAPRLGHLPLDPYSLDRSLDALEQRSPVDAEKLSRCNANIQRELAAKLADAEAAIARGDRDGALSRVKEIDRRYGGLAAPAIVELERKRQAQRGVDIGSGSSRQE